MHKLSRPNRTLLLLCKIINQRQENRMHTDTKQAEMFLEAQLRFSKPLFDQEREAYPCNFYWPFTTVPLLICNQIFSSIHKKTSPLARVNVAPENKQQPQLITWQLENCSRLISQRISKQIQVPSKCSTSACRTVLSPVLELSEFRAGHLQLLGDFRPIPFRCQSGAGSLRTRLAARTENVEKWF